MADKFAKFLDKFRESSGSDSVLNSRYGEPPYWISTGSWALNRICSGSIFKGIPAGRVTILAGESSVGKSLIAATIIANAQKDGCKHVFYFDAEGGASKKFFENAGCDPSTIEEIVVSSVENAQIEILKVFKMISDYKEECPDDKFLCVLDSLGALVADKLIRDADKEEVKSDMGSRAKIVNNMMKAITIPCLKSGTPMIVINHVYQNPGSLFPTKVKNQGGGMGLQYMGSLNIQCSRCELKPGDSGYGKEEAKEADSFYTQSKLNFYTIKNRMVRPSLSCDIFLDYKKGFVRQFESLFDAAVQGGFFAEAGQGWYTCPTCAEPEKKIRKSELVGPEGKKYWATFIKEFDKWSQDDLSYKSISQSEPDFTENEHTTEEE